MSAESQAYVDNILIPRLVEAGLNHVVRGRGRAVLLCGRPGLAGLRVYEQAATVEADPGCQRCLGPNSLRQVSGRSFREDRRGVWRSQIRGVRMSAPHLSKILRIHQSLRVTPAMASGVSDHVWSLEEIVGPLGGIS